MSLYEPAFTAMMAHEDATLSGKVSSEPNGGFCRFGINSVANPKAVEDGFFKLNRQDALLYASDFYKYNYWSVIRGYQITYQNVANKLFDLAVNTGIREATLIAQRAINILHDVGKGVTIDGEFGPATLAALNDLEPDELVSAIKAKAREFYVELTQNKPELQPYLAGWLARVDS